MEQAEKEMSEISEEQAKTVRKYLLGNLDDKVKMRRIEEKILLDDDFAERLSIAEDALIDDYLDGRLNEPERERFLRFFLAAPENKKKLRLIQNLRTHAAKRLEEKSAAARRPWQKLFFLPAFRFAAAAVLLLTALGYGVWRTAFYQSDADRGLAELRQAYRGQRPAEFRLTAEFDYAPFSGTRGASPPVVDAKARIRAEGYLLNATENSSDPKAHHNLGLLYLAGKRFDLALDEFNLALKSAPEDAAVYNDLGAAFLEKASQAEADKKFDESVKNKALSLKSINRALEIEPAMLDALFNKALVLQKMPADGEARAAWEQYLEKDSASPWAEEARKNLEALKRQSNQSKDKSEVLRDFLDAFRNKDNTRAWAIASQTKELITGVMVEPQLTQVFLEADSKSEKEKAHETLSALLYLGWLEKQNAGDSFSEELANYYSGASSLKREKLSQAHALMREGYRSLLKAEWQSSLGSFQKAKEMFSASGNLWEAGIAEYQICYCLSQLKQIRESNERLKILSNWSERKNYKWLGSLADGWVGNNYSLLGEHSRAIIFAQKSLKTSEEISDTHNSQKASNHLTHEYLLMGDSGKALENIYNGFKFSNLYFQSLRQKSRNLLFATRGLSELKYYDAAAAFGSEQIYVAQTELKDTWLTNTAHNQLAVIYGEAKNFQAAFREIDAGFQTADSFSNEAMRRNQTTETRLMLAHLQREANDCQTAIDNYSQVIDDYENTDFSIYKYDARKGRLLCLTTLKNDFAVREEMPLILRMFDENRQKIAEESSRNIFFDNEQSVYDIAIDYAYMRLKDSEQAFDYAENSRARSLLSDIQNNQSQPLDLTEIRRRMPADVQIVYYAVLADKLLIWQISKVNFLTSEKSIKATELAGKIDEFTKLLNQKSDSREQAAELYDLLIAPLVSTLEANKPVCVIADKNLFRLPFAALVSPLTNKYLIEEYSLVYAPSAAIFVSETESAVEKTTGGRDETILSVGNPAFSRLDHPDLADLPDAAREAEEIGAFYKSASVFVDRRADKERIISNLNEADVIHFAGHYVANGKSPLLSKLVLASGDLAVEEIMQRKLPRTRLVILSACETGVEGFYKGEGMIGAARAFLAAGVPLVVASQWAVDSEATAELMIKLHYYRRQKGMATVAALRQAQVDMLTGGGGDNQRFNQPYYWAGFLPIGGDVDY